MLVLGLKHCTTQPLLCTADVSWDVECPGQTCEVELIESSVEWNDDTRTTMETTLLPRLIAGLREAITRGKPRTTT